MEYISHDIWRNLGREPPVLGWTAAPMGYRHIDVRPLSGALGAEIGGVALGQALADDVFAEILQAFLDHSVIFFRDQTLEPERQIAFARRFGAPEGHPSAHSTQEHPEVVRVW